jgi:hypothetical protein
MRNWLFASALIAKLLDRRSLRRLRDEGLIDDSRLSGRVGGMTGSPMVIKSLQYFETNYAVVFASQLLTPSGSRHYIGSRDCLRRCRFCGQDESATTFKKEAHAIAASVGNIHIFSYEECDSCNERFAKIEDDLGKYTMADRTIARVRGRIQIPTLKPAKKNGGAWRVEAKHSHLSVFKDAGEEILTVDETTNSLKIKMTLQKYRPKAIFKCFVKMALSVMPEAELHNFRDLIEWLRKDGVDEGSFTHGAGYKCTKITGEYCFRYPLVVLLCRKTDAHVPYGVFSVSFGYQTYQIFIPCPKMDTALEGKDITTFLFPTIDMVRPARYDGFPTVENVDLSSSEFHETQEWTTSFRFNAMIRTN